MIENYEAPKDNKQLWEMHAGLIHHIAKKLHHRFPEILEYDEKVTHVFIGMAKAIPLWDPAKGSYVKYAYMAAVRDAVRAIRTELSQIKPGPKDEPGKYGYFVTNSKHNFQEDLESVDHGAPCSGDIVLYKMFRNGQYHKDSPVDRIELMRRITVLRRELPTRKHKRAFDWMLKGYSQAEAAKKAGFASRQRLGNAFRRAINVVINELGETKREF